MKIYIAIIIIISIISCSSRDNRNYEDFVKRINEYNKNLDFKIQNDSVWFDTNKFKISNYIKLYNQLSLDTLWSLNTECSINTVSGADLMILAKPKDSTINYEHKGYYYWYYNLVDSISFTEHIIPNHTKMGYFQFFILYFNKRIPSNYTTLIFTKQKLKEITSSHSVLSRFNKEEKMKIMQLDIEPKFLLSEKECSIDILMFNPWYGFYRSKYKIYELNKCEYIKKISDSLVFKYNCHVCF